MQTWHLVTTYKLFINVDYCLHPNVYLDSIHLTEYVFICKDWVNNHIVIERTLNEKKKKSQISKLSNNNCSNATHRHIYRYIYIFI